MASSQMSTFMVILMLVAAGFQICKSESDPECSTNSQCGDVKCCTGPAICTPDQTCLCPKKLGPFTGEYGSPCRSVADCCNYECGLAAPTSSCIVFDSKKSNNANLSINSSLGQKKCVNSCQFDLKKNGVCKCKEVPI